MHEVILACRPGFPWSGDVSVHSLLVSPIARDLFHKAIVQSGGSRDSVLTARPMSRDGVDPNYPVSAETIGINFAHSMGIEGTDYAALAKLRALSAEENLTRPLHMAAKASPTAGDADTRGMLGSSFHW